VSPRREDSVCGLDEAGRGALSGPIVVAAVVLAREADLDAAGVVVRDSKLLTAGQRLRLYEHIVQQSGAIATEVIEAADINAHGINWANITGFRRLIDKVEADSYVVDGLWALGELRNAQRVECRVRADETVPAALAAGVVAKVVRDRLMASLDARWPGYGWASNTGHGTAGHVEAIRRLGVTPEHRRQFVSTALGPRRRRARRSLVPLKP
jgi:ribonuclease HII